MHAGSFVVRSAEPVRRSPHCPAGYFSVFPRGVVCLDQGATLDLAHPTLAAMALPPKLDEALPYAYGRTQRETPLLERDAGQDEAVRALQALPKGTGFAVVGSWTARVGDGAPERLGLLTNGRFVRAADLEAARPSQFSGYALGDGKTLPLAFVVKRGVRRWKFARERFEKEDALDYHAVLPLSGRFRTVDGTKYWAAENDRWVRHQDVTLVQRRTKFPEFVRAGQRWLDVGVQLGTLVAYEGREPILATLVSPGRDRLGGAKQDADAAVTRLGTFEVAAKHVSLLAGAGERARERYPLLDLPWVLELSSGQLLYGAYWHDRFGTEYGPGDVMLSPGDAQRLFAWATPSLPKGWHSVSALGDKTLVLLRP